MANNNFGPGNPYVYGGQLYRQQGGQGGQSHPHPAQGGPGAHPQHQMVTYTQTMQVATTPTPQPPNPLTQAIELHYETAMHLRNTARQFATVARDAQLHDRLIPLNHALDAWQKAGEAAQHIVRTVEASRPMLHQEVLQYEGRAHTLQNEARQQMAQLRQALRNAITAMQGQINVMAERWLVNHNEVRDWHRSRLIGQNESSSSEAESN